MFRYPIGNIYLLYPFLLELFNFLLGCQIIKVVGLMWDKNSSLLNFWASRWWSLYPIFDFFNFTLGSGSLRILGTTWDENSSLLKFLWCTGTRSAGQTDTRILDEKLESLFLLQFLFKVPSSATLIRLLTVHWSFVFLF